MNKRKKETILLAIAGTLASCVIMTGFIGFSNKEEATQFLDDKNYKKIEYLGKASNGECRFNEPIRDKFNVTINNQRKTIAVCDTFLFNNKTVRHLNN